MELKKIVLTHPNCDIGFADIEEQKDWLLKVFTCVTLSYHVCQDSMDKTHL